MYNIHISGTQALQSSLVAISLSETDDEGTTCPLATQVSTVNQHFPELEPLSLEEFLEQVVLGVVKALSSVTDWGLTELKSADPLDGGWGGGPGRGSA